MGLRVVTRAGMVVEGDDMSEQTPHGLEPTACPKCGEPACRDPVHESFTNFLDGLGWYCHCGWRVTLRDWYGPQLADRDRLAVIVEYVREKGCRSALEAAEAAAKGANDAER